MSQRKRTSLLALLLVVGMLVMAACGSSSSQGDSSTSTGDSTPAPSGEAEQPSSQPQQLEKVTFRLNHLPWGMHIPYFVALEKGYYEEEGLDIEILPGSGAQEAITMVGSGNEDFGIGFIDVFLVARAQGIPIVTIAMDTQTNTSALFSLKSSGIETPKDLEGKTIAQPPASSMKYIIPVALKKAGVDIDKVEMVDAPAGSEIQLMIAGQIDVSVGLTAGQPLTLADMGYESNVLTMEDFGLELYGSLIFTNEKTLKERPHVVEKFLRATLRGFNYAYDNMAEATELLLKHRPDRNMSEMEKFNILLDTYRTDDVKEHGYWGVMTESRWQSSMQVLLDGGVMPQEVDVTEVFTTEFLENLPEAREFADKLFAGPPQGME